MHLVSSATTTDLDIGFVVFGLAPLVPVLLVLWWYRRRSRDEIFEGITPGELPGVGHQVRRARVPGGEWSGTVAVRFTPPDGVTPGLAGTIIDGKADPADLSATLIDLAVRGHYRISPTAHSPAAYPATPAPAAGGQQDYLITRAEPPLPIDGLRPFEQTLILGLFAHGPVARLSELGPDFAQRMREAQVGLYREVVERHWYTQHPRIEGRRLGCLLTPVLVLAGLLAAVGVWQLRRDGEATLLGFAFPVGLLLAAYLLFKGARKRSARTAEGTAVRIQTLGFREYLTKAEANQIRFEQARDLFSRYLPYAIVFGVAQRWAHLFGEVAARGHAAGWGDAWFDLAWFDPSALDLLGDGAGALVNALDGADGIGNLAQLADLGDLGDLIGGLGDTLGSFADGVGDFASSASNLLDVGNGCGDGCDLPGCDLP